MLSGASPLTASSPTLLASVWSELLIGSARTAAALAAFLAHTGRVTIDRSHALSSASGAHACGLSVAVNLIAI
jgi:hypothetical protein